MSPLFTQVSSLAFDNTLTGFLLTLYFRLGPLLSQAQILLLDNLQEHSEAPTQTTKEEMMQRGLQGEGLGGIPCSFVALTHRYLAAQNLRSRFLAQYLYFFSLQPSTICTSVHQALICAHLRPVYHVGLLALSPAGFFEQFFMPSIFLTALRHWIGLEV